MKTVHRFHCGQAKNHVNSLLTAEQALGVGCSCLIHYTAVQDQVPAISATDNQCQSLEQTTGSPGEIKGKLAINPDAGAGPNEDWARSTPPGEVETAEPARSLAKKPSLEEFLLRTPIFIK